MNHLTVKKSSKVAAVDFVPAWGDLEGNIRRLAEAAEKVAAQGVDYAVFPETAVSGYLFSDSAELAPYLADYAREYALLITLIPLCLIFTMGQHFAKEDSSLPIDSN
ncbi:nitrilase-related carbon-nitrogen hydrolase [Providencia stuartii]|uniref:CN hydrolase domain-containing protein n=1 Tax=Providencia stuartii ATCC 25827 TaxID=471874 RepID=A0AA87CST7_PROST|nr:nitrilase-related carbon-nitrogen hydrolase [Providencia stuartii]EDU61544.1 hypothetical protein PROSTU_00433 [Providencia stuartii ATCC 25827]